MHRLAGVGAALLMLGGVTLAFGSGRIPAPFSAKAGTTPVSRMQQLLDTKVQHIVIIDKENRSFDSIFGRFPGADRTTWARTSTGKLVPLIRAPDHLLLDIDHSSGAALRAVDGGAMDRFNQAPGARQNGKDEALSQFWPQDIPGYYAYARHFTLDDHFFS
ncbi:MAG TPA: alkaline phosphatase family protein, partial [Chloroflexota bacterium]|nr:alkaline phosphatase family protein [Chloroflexota bacterium]